MKNLGYYLAIVNTYLIDLQGDYYLKGDNIIYKDKNIRIILEQKEFFVWFANYIKDKSTNYDYIKNEDIQELEAVAQ